MIPNLPRGATVAGFGGLILSNVDWTSTFDYSQWLALLPPPILVLLPLVSVL
jgi:hypothetical protein